MVTVYKYADMNGAAKKAKPAPDRFVAEIDTREGSPKKLIGASPAQLGSVVMANLKSLEVKSFNFSTDHRKDSHSRLKETVPPGMQPTQLSKAEAEKMQTILRSYKNT